MGRQAQVDDLLEESAPSGNVCLAEPCQSLNAARTASIRSPAS